MRIMKRLAKIINAVGLAPFAFAVSALSMLIALSLAVGCVLWMLAHITE